MRPRRVVPTGFDGRCGCSGTVRRGGPTEIPKPPCTVAWFLLLEADRTVTHSLGVSRTTGISRSVWAWYVA